VVLFHLSFSSVCRIPTSFHLFCALCHRLLLLEARSANTFPPFFSPAPHDQLFYPFFSHEEFVRVQINLAPHLSGRESRHSTAVFFFVCLFSFTDVLGRADPARASLGRPHFNTLLGGVALCILASNYFFLIRCPSITPRPFCSQFL